MLTAIVMALLMHAGEPGPVSKGAAACWEEAITQGELNACAGLEVKEADDELNRVYQLVRARHAGNSRLLTRLRSAQRAWIALRDADIEATWSSPNPRAYGSAGGMCINLARARMTRERTKHLRQWLSEGEGDVCDGFFGVEESDGSR